MREVLDNIYCITQKFRWPMFKPPANIYVIASKKGIIFDSGYGTYADKRFFRKEYLKIKDHQKLKGKDLRAEYVIPSHSHGDHFSGLENIRRFTGAKVCLTRMMADTIASGNNLIRHHKISSSPVRVLWKEERTKAAGRWDLFFPHIFGLKFLSDPDKIIKEHDFIDDGERVWRVIPVKGHCDDHIAIYNEETGIMFSGDNILQKVITWLGPPRSSIKDYCNSLKHIMALKNLKIILPAHGRPIENPKERIKEILLHRRKKTEVVVNTILDKGSKGIRFRELRDNVYPPGTKFWVKSSGEGWILSTIEFLMENRLVHLRRTGKKTKIIPKEDFFKPEILNSLLDGIYME